MFLTKECDYGIRIIRALADNKKKSVQTICEIEHVPLQYAYKILKKLERGGLVKSWRGPDGGYRLIKSPRSFTMYDVVAAIDGKLFVSECLNEEQNCTRNTPETPCSVHFELARIQALIIEEMKSKTMEDTLQ